MNIQVDRLNRHIRSKLPTDRIARIAELQRLIKIAEEANRCSALMSDAYCERSGWRHLPIEHRDREAMQRCAHDEEHFLSESLRLLRELVQGHHHLPNPPELYSLKLLLEAQLEELTHDDS